MNLTEKDLPNVPSESAIFNSGQCIHKFVKNGHGREKQKLICLLCKKQIMEERTRLRTCLAEQALYLLPYFNKNMSIRKTAVAANRSTKTVRLAFQLIKKFKNMN